MCKRLLILFVSLMSLAATGVAGVATAAPHALQLARREGGNGGMSLNEAVQQVRRETGGRVLSADETSEGGRRVYRIKVLTPSGHVRVYVIDAQSGARL
jgi:uncharacterized membrane protein YkoI